METVEESIYDHPKYYDLVFGADCAAELNFIEQCAERYADGPARRLFEPACGTGRLLFHFATRGYQVGGLDLNPKAVAFCNARFQRRGFQDRVSVDDMSDFRQRRKWDVGFNTINSFRHLDSESAARSHLECMARSIRKGGLYLLGLHLTPTAVRPSDTESWAARRGHLSINTHMWPIHRDKRKRVERFGIRFDVRMPTRSLRISDELVLRSYTAAQMKRLLASCPAWDVAETFDFGYDIDEPIEVDTAAEDVVYVLKRNGKPFSG